MTRVIHRAVDGPLRWLRANPFPVAIAAAAALFMAGLTWQSTPQHLAVSVLVAMVVVILTREAIARIRAWGGRAALIVPVLACAGLALGLQVVPLVLELGWVRVALIVVAWGGLTLAATEPRWIVDIAGGPRVEWLVLRERAALWHDVRDLTDEGLADAEADITARVRSFDRFRTRRTAAYIDIFQRLAIGHESQEAKERIAVHFAELEDELIRDLGVPPAWEAEFAPSGPVAGS